jgi:hypothetical protein
MRKWFAEGDQSPYAKKSIPANAPRNWPISGPKRADTLQKDTKGLFNFTNQSDSIPQKLELVPVKDLPGGYHPVLELPGQGSAKVRYLEHFPDHMHEGETLGFGGVEGSTPWTLDDVLTFEGEQFKEYPKTAEGRQEVPMIIAKGTVIGGHTTTVESGKPCDSGFRGDDAPTEAKQINTLSLYDGHKVGVGRVLTDSSFHHFLDLNLIGDPCARGERRRGLDSEFLDDMTAFFHNCVAWLAKA